MAQGYLQHRTNHYLTSGNSSSGGGSGSGGNGPSLSDPLVGVLEFVESPLQQMKRAGLGLLSQGLGR